MNNNIVKKIEEILLDENPWLKHYYDRVRFPDGTKGRYNRIVEGNENRGIVILPFNNKKELGLVKLYRYPIQLWQWELPRGFGENNLTAEDNAKRELEEEMNMHPEKLVVLGSIFPNSGLLSSEVDIVIAHNVKSIKGIGENEKRMIKEIKFFNINQIKEMVCNGIIKDGFTIVAYTLANLKGYL
jgi:ADP-ribose pyrophosphatase YjhB (NUDIX family)